MTVLTQSPLPISPHALPCPSLASSQPGATAAISMRSYFDNKPRVAETAHIECAPRRQRPLPEIPPPLDPSGSSSSVYSNESADCHSVLEVEDAPTSFPDTTQYAGYAHAEPQILAPSARAAPAHSSGDRPRSKYDELVDALMHDPPVLSTPPPVPPKSDVRKAKSVSIVAPSDEPQEDVYPYCDHTVSEPGHDFTFTVTEASSSDRVPHGRTLASQSLSGHTNPTHGHTSRLSWADKASVPIYRNSFPLSGHQLPSTLTSFPATPQHGRRKLKKSITRPSSLMNPLPSSSSGCTGTGSRIWRALSLHIPSGHKDESPRSLKASKFFRTRSATHTSFLDSDPMAMRRWTLAMADVPDEVLVQELDKLWKEGRSRVSKSRTPTSSQQGHGSDYDSRDWRPSSFVYGNSSGSQWRTSTRFQLGGESDSEDEEGLEETVEEAEEDAEDAEEWRTARRALLCCRELVRTERNYQARLRQLLNAQSSHPMFSLLLSYVPALLEASDALLVRLVDDPSAWGVSAAFIGCEEDLEAAFVAWCGTVGEFFADPEEKDKRGRKLVRKANDVSASTHGHDEFGVRQKGGKGAAPAPAPAPPLSTRSLSQGGLGLQKPKVPEARRMSLFGMGESGGMFTAALGTGLAFGLSPVSQPHGYVKHGSTASVGKVTGPAGSLSRTLSAWKRKSMPSSLYYLPSSAGTLPSPVAPTAEEKKLTVRDLAIQPTQRVMRYVLQYKDLLAHTPVSSPSRGLVERALESALRIAKKCDRAQGNSAFLRRP
ncbi:hypothetical protein IEO21_01727 [Rhodonia placenta]|uniref:DH domain-containing protein n=1 Tax=Rhodonia placenta TaxID=104341 RepID=A0A8H7P9I6_9APHY|nr:hypothetical protein IEO21_01727 [Postia placenta]